MVKSRFRNSVKFYHAVTIFRFLLTKVEKLVWAFTLGLRTLLLDLSLVRHLMKVHRGWKFIYV